MRLLLTSVLLIAATASAAAESVERSRITVVDGDTIRVDGEKVRLVGFDTPENGDDTARCDAEREQSKKAAARLAQLLDSGAIDIRYRKHLDQYERRLGLLRVNGKKVSDMMMREGLAVRYKGSGPKHDWCPRYRFKSQASATAR